MVQTVRVARWVGKGVAVELKAKLNDGTQFLPSFYVGTECRYGESDGSGSVTGLSFKVGTTPLIRSQFKTFKAQHTSCSFSTPPAKQLI